MSAWGRILLEKLIANTVDTSHLLRNLKIHYNVQRSPPLHHILSEINPAYHILTFYLFTIHFNTILPRPGGETSQTSLPPKFWVSFATYV
jgi:hypothetical protein